MQPPTRNSRTMLLTVLSVGTTTSTTSAAETTAAAKSPPRQPLSTAHDTTAAEGQMPGTVGAPPRITALLSTTRVDRMAATARASSMPTTVVVRSRWIHMATVQTARTSSTTNATQGCAIPGWRSCREYTAYSRATGRRTLSPRQRAATTLGSVARLPPEATASAGGALAVGRHVVLRCGADGLLRPRLGPADRGAVDGRALDARVLDGDVLSAGLRRAGRLVRGLVLGATAIEGLGLGPGRREQALLHGRGVHVDVLLPGQEHQLVHDLVGDRPQDEPVVFHALVAGEVERLAHPDTDPHDPRDDLAGRLGLVRADHGDRDDLHLALEGHPGDAGAAAVEAPVGRARALGVDAEQLAAPEHLEPGAQRGVARLAAGAVDGQLPDALEERGREPALDAATGEVVALGEERDASGDDERQEDRVGEGQMVAREDRGALCGDVLLPLHPRTEEELDDRPDDDRLEEPVEQPCPPSACDGSNSTTRAPAQRGMRGSGDSIASREEPIVTVLPGAAVGFGLRARRTRTPRP